MVVVVKISNICTVPSRSLVQIQPIAFPIVGGSVGVRGTQLCIERNLIY